MRLLLDQNLSPRLGSLLTDLWPEITHVRDVGLAAARDREVWDYASESGAVIVSKDSDFDHFSFLYGAPPKVIWLRCGNCSTDDLAQLVRTHAAKIGAFGRDPEAALLVLPPAAFGNSSRTP